MLKHKLSGSIMGFLSMMGGESIDVKNLFNIDFETGDLSQFDAIVNPDADLTVDATGAMGGTDTGLSVEIDDVNPVYGIKNVPLPASDKFRMRFYIDPNGWVMGAGDSFDLARWFDTGGSFLYGWSLQIQEVGGNWQTKIHYANDGGYGGQQAGNFLVDAPQYIEIYIQRSSSDVASDGRIDWWIDGGAETPITGIDNYDRLPTMDVVQIGAVAAVDVGTLGIFFLDEIAGNDNGEEIGA